MDQGDVGQEPARAAAGDVVSADVHRAVDDMESQQWSQGSAGRVHSPTSHSPTSDWQSEVSLRDEELQQALARATAAESKVAALQEERDRQQGELMQLMDDIGTLQSQLDEQQAEKILRVCRRI
jgi:peptidoglycan hydrolase CwlO-like protein